MFYKICSNCGSHLDPCERCDCQEEKRNTKTTQEKKINEEEVKSSGKIYSSGL